MNTTWHATGLVVPCSFVLRRMIFWKFIKVFFYWCIRFHHVLKSSTLFCPVSVISKSNAHHIPAVRFFTFIPLAITIWIKCVGVWFLYYFQLVRKLLLMMRNLFACIFSSLPGKALIFITKKKVLRGSGFHILSNYIWQCCEENIISHHSKTCRVSLLHLWAGMHVP